MESTQHGHTHSGHCSGRIRRDHGKLVAEVICDKCGAVVQKLGVVR